MAKPDGPVELWLRQRNMEVVATMVHEDETTEAVDVVEALSIRGAQREMTGWMIEEGYKPVGRWVTELEDNGEPLEVSRKFTPAKEVTPTEQR